MSSQMTMIEQLQEWGACEDGVAFAQNYASWRKLWVALDRADWMFWLLDKLGCPQREMSLACLAATKPEVYHLLTDDRSKAVFQVVPAYWRGEMGRDEMQSIAEAAWEAAGAAEAAAEAAAWAAAGAAAGAAARAAAWAAAGAAARAAAWAAVWEAAWAAAWAAAGEAVWAVAREAAELARAAAYQRMCNTIRREVDFEGLIARLEAM